MLISVIIPTKNRCGLLRETLDSLCKQTYTDWEAIVVDDGSNDGTIEMVEAITDERVHLLRRDRMPTGAPTCRNIGAEKAKGEYLIFLDSDDLLLPHALERRVDVIQSHPEYDFLAYAGEMFTSYPGDMGKLWNMPTKQPDFDRFLGMDTVWQTTGPIWRADFFHRIGCWDETLVCGQDSELHLRALSHEPNYVLLAEADYGIRADNTSRQSLGVKGMTVEGQLSHAQSVVKLVQSSNCAKLTRKQKSIAAGRLLYHAIHIRKFMSGVDYSTALTLWKHARKHHLTSLVIYLLGRLWIKRYRSFWGNISAYFINRVESGDFLLINRAVLGTIPTSCIEEDHYDGRYHRQPSFVCSATVRKGLMRYLMRKLRRRAA